MSDPSSEQQDQDQDKKPAAKDKDKDKDKDADQKGQDGKKDDDKKDDDKKDDGPSPEKKRKVRIILIAVAAVLALIGLAFFIWHELVGKYHESTDDAYIQADAVTIAPKVGGYVEEVLVSENQDVQQGQPLVRIDPRDYRAQTEQFEAQIAIAKANADTVRAQIAEQESAVAEARAQLAAAQANASYAAGEAQRYAPLVAIGAETAEQLATRRNQAKQSADQVKTARAALASAEKRINTLHAQVRQAEAQGGTAAAQLKAAEVNLQSTTLTASIAGRIGDSTVRVGQFVQPGARLMTLVPVGRLYIEANFKETQIGLMRVGQPAQIKVDALPGAKLRGHVQSVAPGTGAQFSLLPPQNATGNFTKIVQRVPVRIALEADPDVRAILVPGLSVKVEVETKAAKDAVDDLKDRQKDESKQIKKGGEQQQKDQENRQPDAQQRQQIEQQRARRQAQGGQ
ncbi:HlyD family secretion protein [Massilia sp. 9096]|uniref:HlyD family secretion protein n=1 Tax=Massilia sp. 9096 TaxID=1500894 RepID=UPI0009DF20D0|nr:HlyD family secretion protein [Massilia sp. 9096]